MPRPVLYTAAAQRHLRSLHAYVSRESSPERATAYVGRIVAYCDGFAEAPERGTRPDDILPGLRTVGFERRVTIAFMVLHDRILIEGVFYGGRAVDVPRRGPSG